MTATPQELGIQWLHIGGMDLALPADAIQETSAEASTSERMADSFTVIDGPYLGEAGIVPVDVVDKYTWALAWERVNAADKQRLIFERIKARRGFIDFCPWQRVVERFTADGSSLVFRMMRRLANVTLSSNQPSGISWGPVVEVNGTVISSGISYGSPDGKGRVLATFSGSSPATLPSAGAAVDIIYTAAFLVRAESIPRSFSVPFTEGRTMTFVET